METIYSPPLTNSSSHRTGIRITPASTVNTQGQSNLGCFICVILVGLVTVLVAVVMCVELSTPKKWETKHAVKSQDTPDDLDRRQICLAELNSFRNMRRLGLMLGKQLPGRAAEVEKKKEKHLEEKHLEEKHLEEKHLEEKHLEEKHLVEEKHLEEKHLKEKHLEEKHLDEDEQQKQEKEKETEMLDKSIRGQGQQEKQKMLQETGEHEQQKQEIEITGKLDKTIKHQQQTQNRLQKTGRRGQQKQKLQEASIRQQKNQHEETRLKQIGLHRQKRVEKQNMERNSKNQRKTQDKNEEKDGKPSLEGLWREWCQNEACDYEVRETFCPEAFLM